LDERHAQVAHHAQVGGVFDALGDHAAAEIFRQLQHGLDGLHLLAVQMDSVAEVAIHFQVFGL